MIKDSILNEDLLDTNRAQQKEVSIINVDEMVLDEEIQNYQIAPKEKDIESTKFDEVTNNDYQAVSCKRDDLVPTNMGNYQFPTPM